jgi:hypothetical protein
VTDTENNTIRLIRTALTPLPELLMTAANGQLVLSWPVSAANYVLQARSSLTPGSPWTAVTDEVTISGDSFVFVQTMDAPAAFFRLHKP